MVSGFPWGASNLNFVFLRYSDIILLKAEALIEQNKDLDGARALINMIRTRAAESVDPFYSPVDVNPTISTYRVGEYGSAGWTQDYARKAVRMERRLELAMEGHRWFDLVRWGNTKAHMEAYQKQETPEAQAHLATFIEGKHELFPIPSEEIILNDALQASDQNPGY